MIKIYSEKELDKSCIKSILKNEDLWDYPTDELGFLLELEEENEEDTNTSYVLINGRLYEME